MAPATGQTYSAAVTGGTPAVLGVFRGLAPGSADLNFAGSPVLELGVLDAAGRPITPTWVGLFADQANARDSVGTYGPPTTYLVKPGDYAFQLVMYLNDDTGKTWIYDFDVTNLSAGDALIPFRTGDAPRTAMVGGPQAATIDGSATPLVETTSPYELVIASSVSWLRNVLWYKPGPVVASGHIYPHLEVRDATGVIKAATDTWSLNYLLPSAGTYSISGSYGPAGPYLPTPIVAPARTVTISAPAYSLTATPDRITAGTETAVTITVQRAETPLAGAVPTLPVGARVSGSAAATAVTGADGTATFSITPTTPGALYVSVTDGTRPAGRVRVYVTDNRSGLLHVTLTGSGELPQISRTLAMASAEIPAPTWLDPPVASGGRG